MSKTKINRSQSREAALQILYCQSFADKELGQAVAAVEATHTIEALQTAGEALREYVTAAMASISALEAAIHALKEAQKSDSDRKVKKDKPVEEGTLTTRLQVHESRSAAIDSMRKTASLLEGANKLFDEDGFCQRLLKNFTRHRQHVESVLSRSLEGWSVKRLMAEDGAILRLGITELIYHPDVPPKVIINEYLEMAKRYGDDESVKLINGVLDRVLRDNPREEVAAGKEGKR